MVRLGEDTFGRTTAATISQMGGGAGLRLGQARGPSKAARKV